MSKRTGIDIGASGVRVVVTGDPNSEGVATVESVGVAPMREGAVVAGRIRDPQRVAHALDKAMKEAGAPRRGPVVGLASPDAAVALSPQSAQVAAEDRVKAFRRSGMKVVPALETKDCALSMNVASGYVSGEGVRMNRLVVAAALRTEMAALESACLLAGISPRAIDLTGAAVLRALLRIPANDDTVSAVADIGAGKTTISVRRGAHLRSIRTVGVGGVDLTKAVMGAVEGEDFAAAELRKMKMKVGRSAAVGYEDLASHATNPYGLEVALDRSALLTEAEVSLNTAADNLIEQIAVSIEADAETYGSRAQGVTLVGGGALMKGLKDSLALRLGMPVWLGTPWATLGKSKKLTRFRAADGRDRPEALLMLAPAVGLALWEDRT